jgi:hypothetical protein
MRRMVMNQPSGNAQASNCKKWLFLVGRKSLLYLDSVRHGKSHIYAEYVGRSRSAATPSDTATRSDSGQSPSETAPSVCLAHQTLLRPLPPPIRSCTPTHPLGPPDAPGILTTTPARASWFHLHRPFARWNPNWPHARTFSAEITVPFVAIIFF